MDKKQFAQNVIEEVKRNVPIVDVATELLGQLRYKGGNYWTLCPFHNDAHLGSFSISSSKNIYKCFSCGEGGDVVELYKKLKGYEFYTECAMDLAVKYGIISRSDYDEYMGDNKSKFDYSKKVIKKIEKRFEEENLEKRKSVKYLNLVYRALRFLCGLSEEHKKYLMEVRKMTEEETKEYFTMPTKNIVDDLVALIKKYIKNFTPEHLKGVPGFFYNKKEGKWSNAINSGIGICIKNAFGQIEGVQIRRDKVEDGFSRYVWFSSTFSSRVKHFEYGSKAKLAVDVVYPTLIKTSTIFITEGRFKARVLAKEFNAVVLSVQGVGNWKLIKEEIKNLKESDTFNERYVGVGDADIRHIMVSFDADMSYNLQVLKQAVKMVKNLEDLNLEIKFAIWNDELGKGIDDMILAGHKKNLDSIGKNLFIKKSVQTVKEALSISGKSEIKDLPKELVKELYIKNILSQSKKYANIYK